MARWGRSSRYGESMWAPYVPVADRRRQAEKTVQALRKKGKTILPVVIEGRKIAKSFWGEAWCDNLEAYSDYANRLPRGGTYVRNGSVVHLEIAEGKIEALVSGSSVYTVKIAIAKLPRARWSALVAECSGKIGSLVGLLQGKLSAGVMEVVTHKDRGLFPSPKEITFSCSCPDGAWMCKHVAAVMYGVGARLDTQPSLLFELRGLDPAELFTSAALGPPVPEPGAKGKVLETAHLGSVFGIDIDEGPGAAPEARPGSKRAPRTKPDTLRIKPPVVTASPSVVTRASRTKPAAPRVTVKLAELAAAGMRVGEVQEWLKAGKLSATAEAGTYETTLALREELLARGLRTR